MAFAMEASMSCAAESDVVIADVARSPLGLCDPNGALAGIRPADLLAQVVAAMLERTHLKAAEVTRVLVGGGAAYARLATEACALVGVSARVEVPLVRSGSAQS